MGLFGRRRGKSEPAVSEDRSEEGADVREVGEPDPAKVTVQKDPVTGKWVSLKGM